MKNRPNIWAHCGQQWAQNYNSAPTDTRHGGIMWNTPYLVMGKIPKIERFSWLNSISAYRVRVVCAENFTIPHVDEIGCNPRNIKICKTLKFVQDGKSIVLKVRGLIYHGDFHFTSCMIGTDEIVWYHDGMTTGSTCENEGDFDKFSNKKMMKNKGNVLTMVVYARV